MRIKSAALTLVLLLAAAAGAVAPGVPGSFNYQGVLLDSGGQPQTGPVDLTVRLWDQGFSGTLLYKQDRDNTVLVDGVFSILIGPTGIATDTPTNPLTTTLVDALSMDLGASGDIWIEVSVDGNAPLGRNQLQAVPFAVKAETAEQATNAVNILTAGGVSGGILDSIWQDFAFDGGDPPNSDPSEGTADTDADGVPNFLDSDNDNDGFIDEVELAQGSNINLITPRIDSFSGSGSAFVALPLTATGGSFDPSMNVTVGGTGVSPTAVTPTSFDFVAPAMPVGAYPVVALHPNGESGSADLTYLALVPQLTSFSADGSLLEAILIQATGSDFDPGMTVTVGGTAVTPMSVTPTTFDFLAPPMLPGPHPVVVTVPSGGMASLDLTYVFDRSLLGGDPVEAVALGVDQLLAHTDADYFRDTLDDGQVVLGSVQSVAGSEGGTTSIHWDSTGRLAAFRLNSSTFFTELIVDADLDGDLEAAEAITLESVGVNRTHGASLVHDGSDRVAIGYLRSTSTETRVRIYHDRDGNGDFAGPKEAVTAEARPGVTINSKAIGELAADSAGRLAYVSDDQLASALKVAWDRNGDGDYNDMVGTNPEKFVAATALPFCLGTDFDGSDALVIVYGDINGFHLLRDLSGDGDFADAGEAVTLAPVSQVDLPEGCDVDASGSGLAISVTDGANLSLLVDRNGDGDFADTNENTLEGTANSGPIAVERLGNGTVVVHTQEGLVEDPN
ncbi:MAG: hypothetical protein GY937_17915 [bacterium]|nr:hypothetical protein [bacterium]